MHNCIYVRERIFREINTRDFTQSLPIYLHVSTMGWVDISSCIRYNAYNKIHVLSYFKIHGWWNMLDNICIFCNSHFFYRIRRDPILFKIKFENTKIITWSEHPDSKFFHWSTIYWVNFIDFLYIPTRSDPRCFWRVVSGSGFPNSWIGSQFRDLLLCRSRFNFTRILLRGIGPGTGSIVPLPVYATVLKQSCGSGWVWPQSDTLWKR